MDFGKMRVGTRTLDDATLDIGALKRNAKQLADKDRILTAIANRDHAFLRQVSNYFFDTSGIYSRLVRYLAYLYRYDWMVTPYINSESVKNEKVLADFDKVLMYLDNFKIKSHCGEMALNVIKNGAYYGYVIDTPTKAIVQELPYQYCRSRWFVGDRALVEFNLRFFDENFVDINQRLKVIKSFPKEFAKGYLMWKNGKLPMEVGDNGAPWITLDPELAFKMCLNGSDMPMLTAVIPAVIDLDEAQDLDKKKMMQELLKIVIQKIPMDKNGDLLFDVDEAADMHNNAVKMLGRAVGVDILTTFAEIEVANLSDKTTTASKDDLQKSERSLYNEAGVSQMLFATDGNLALEKSVANDEASLYHLLLSFENFFEFLIDRTFNKNPKKLAFKFNMLTTTIYNFKELAKLYKEQATLGYSKMLPQIALGQSQSSILATAYFENEILKLSEVMQPLQMSSTQSGAPGGSENKNGSANKAASGTGGQTGRAEKPDDQKATKTIQNKESMN